MAFGSEHARTRRSEVGRLPLAEVSRRRQPVGRYGVDRPLAKTATEVKFRSTYFIQPSSPTIVSLRLLFCAVFCGRADRETIREHQMLET